MSRTMAALMLLLAVSFFAGCDDKTTSTDSTSTPATFTFSPNPAVATQNPDDKSYVIKGDSSHADQTIKYPWKTTLTLTMAETGGVGRDITAMQVKVEQASGGIVITPTGSDIEHYEFLPHASGSRLPAKGSTSIGFDVWFDLPNKGREALITVTFSFSDDNKAAFTESAKVNVQ